MEHETRFELAFPSRSATSHTRRSLIARTRSLAAAPPSSVGNGMVDGGDLDGDINSSLFERGHDKDQTGGLLARDDESQEEDES